MCGCRRKGRHPGGFAASPCGGQAGGHSLDALFSEKKTTSRGFRLRPLGETPWMHGRRTPGVGFSALFHASRGFRFAGIVHSGGFAFSSCGNRTSRGFRFKESVCLEGLVLRKPCNRGIGFSHARQNPVDAWKRSQNSAFEGNVALRYATRVSRCGLQQDGTWLTAPGRPAV